MRPSEWTIRGIFIKAPIIGIVVGALIYLTAFLFAQYAGAHIAGHPEWNEWFLRQHNNMGTHCCDLKDAHLINGDDIELYDGPQIAGEEAPTASLHQWFKVRIKGPNETGPGKWYPVYFRQLVADPRKDPNPTGSGVIWYVWYPQEWNKPNGPGSANIFCFAPPPMV